MQEKWETQVWSLSWEDPLEKEMTTHYSILAWKIPWAEKPCRLQSMGSQRVGQNWAHYYNIKIWSKLYILWSIGKDSDAGRDWGQEEKGTTEDEMTGWHHRLDGRESELTQGVGDGQGGLACRNSWGRKSQTRLSDWTELNWTDTHLECVLLTNTCTHITYPSLKIKNISMKSRPSQFPPRQRGNHFSGFYSP